MWGPGERSSEQASERSSSKKQASGQRIIRNRNCYLNWSYFIISYLAAVRYSRWPPPPPPPPGSKRRILSATLFFCAQVVAIATLNYPKCSAAGRQGQRAKG